MRIFDTEATREALPFGPLVEALRTMFAAGCETPPRHAHEIVAADGGVLTSLIMPAWNGRYYGVKTINFAPGNRMRGLPGLPAAYLLFDAVTGVPLALLDGGTLTSYRTAAMREADDDCFAGAALYVDTEEALCKSGKLIGPITRGVFSPGDVHGTLAALARGEAPGRRDREARTVFKSVGTALEDLAAAILVYQTVAC